VNFESQTALEGLIAAGFDRSSPALFAWLGVTMYLQEDAVYAVLRDIAGMPSGSGIIFDYAVSKSEMSLLGRLMVAVVNRRLKRISEPWSRFFHPRRWRRNSGRLVFTKSATWLRQAERAVHSAAEPTVCVSLLLGG
jgi:O-methyltransferase involved in polyketide biosynthesis